LCSVYDAQTGYMLEDRIFRDHRASAKGQGDGGNLKIDLWNDSATAAKVRVQPPVFASRTFIEHPTRRSGHGTGEAGPIALGGAAEFDASPQLANHRSPNPDTITTPHCLGNSLIHQMPTVDPVGNDS